MPAMGAFSSDFEEAAPDFFIQHSTEYDDVKDILNLFAETQQRITNVYGASTSTPVIIVTRNMETVR